MGESMKNHPILTLLISFLWLICLLITSCKKDEVVSTKSEPFIISNLGVTFGPYDPQTGMAGDFIFAPYFGKPFLEFGAVVSTGTGEPKSLPTFEYYLRKDAYVFAIAPGKVVRFILQDDTDDYGFGAVSTKDSDFEVCYDHVLNPLVKEGDIIQPGDTLGNPGNWNASVGRFEIMVNNNRTKYSYCPFCFFDQELIEAYQNKVNQLMIDYEIYRADTTIYDEMSHPLSGCIIDSMLSY
jgi:hypothetical protein